MAARRKTASAKPGNDTQGGKTCADCERSYDWHSEAIDGHLILCRCPLKKKGGQFCVFLKDPACDNFIPRKPD